MRAFGPLGSSQLLTVSTTSARATIGTVPDVNPAIMLTGLQAMQAVWYVKLGDSGVTASHSDGVRIAPPGDPSIPTIIPITAGQTHVAIICEGEPGSVVITPGQIVDGEFSPVGAGADISVTQTDQAFALPTLGSQNPAFRLVSRQAMMGPIWLKLGTSGVTGSITTSMRIWPGGAGDPTIIRVTNAETHVSIFCEGEPGQLLLQPGDVAIRSESLLQIGSSTRYATQEGGGAVTPVAQITGTGPDSSAVLIARYTANAEGPRLFMAKSRNATRGGHTVVQNGDTLGKFSFAGSDGANFAEGANIIAQVDGTPGTNDMPGSLSFRTTPDGAETPVEAFRIRQNQAVDFPEITTPANPAANVARFYCRDVGGVTFLAYRDSAGREILIGAHPVATVAQGAISATATLDIALSTADMYEVDLINLLPVTDAQELWARFSQSGSFLSGAADYSWGRATSAGGAADESDSEITLTDGVENTADSSTGCNITIRIFRPSAASFVKGINWFGGFKSSTGPTTRATTGKGKLIANTNAIDGIRFMFASGNIASGYYAVRSYSYT